EGWGWLWCGARADDDARRFDGRGSHVHWQRRRRREVHLPRGERHALGRSRVVTPVALNEARRRHATSEDKGYGSCEPIGIPYQMLLPLMLLHFEREARAEDALRGYGITRFGNIGKILDDSGTF